MKCFRSSFKSTFSVVLLRLVILVCTIIFNYLSFIFNFNLKIILFLQPFSTVFRCLACVVFHEILCASETILLSVDNGWVLLAPSLTNYLTNLPLSLNTTISKLINNNLTPTCTLRSIDRFVFHDLTHLFISGIVLSK